MSFPTSIGYNQATGGLGRSGVQSQMLGVKHNAFVAILGLVVVAQVALGSAAACPVFRDSLNGAQSVADSGGVIFGSPDFVVGVNMDAVEFDGASHIRYADDAFDATRGTVSLWIAKTSASTFGGILQLGSLGSPNSLGLFYNNGSDLFFEVRTASNDVALITVPDALAGGGFVHVVATWDSRGAEVVGKLFIDGRYKDYLIAPGTVSPETGTLELGTAGTYPWYGDGAVIVDELAFSSHPFLDSEVYAEYVYSSNRFDRWPSDRPASQGPVRVVGKTLWVQGQPFQVKGVGYQPVPVGQDVSSANLDALYTDPCILARDLPLLRELGVNTVRFWSELPDSDLLLDAMYHDGVDPIYGIMGFWVPSYPGVDYSDPVFADDLEQAFRAYVARFKDHPAVLAWGIGNENNLSYDGDLADWYALANRLAAAAHDVEGATYHPTMIINGGMLDFADVAVGSDDVSLADVDLWGHNAYFGFQNHCYFDYYEALTAKPLILTEFGVDAYDMNSGDVDLVSHETWLINQWRQARVRTVGGTVMAYSDEWWKAGDPSTHDDGGYISDQQPDGYSNEEWWGLVSVQSVPGSCDQVTPRPAFYALRDDFARAAGDFDGDGDVDANDRVAFESCFTGAGGGPLDYVCDPGDLDRDRDVDCADFVRFTEAWTESTPPDYLAACAGVIPAASTWGLVVMMLLLLVAAALVLHRPYRWSSTHSPE